MSKHIKLRKSIARVGAVTNPDLGADWRLVETWAASQSSARTRSSYRHQGARLLSRLPVPLASAGMADLQGYVAGLGDLVPATIGLAVSAVRSLYAFGVATGELASDPSRTLQAPPIKGTLAERILDEADVHRLIAGEPDPRNRALLALFYGAGLAGLTWADVVPRGADRGQATVFGKGGKTRAVMLYGQAWTLLAGICGEVGPHAPSSCRGRVATSTPLQCGA